MYGIKLTYSNVCDTISVMNTVIVEGCKGCVEGLPNTPPKLYRGANGCLICVSETSGGQAELGMTRNGLAHCGAIYCRNWTIGNFQFTIPVPVHGA